jgi:hypothetical protein
MSEAAVLERFGSPRAAADSAVAFAASALALQLAAAFFAWRMPVQFSIVTVFLFAGPHNWMEARYFLERWPGRLRKLRTFFLTGSLGVIGLTGSLAALPWLARAAHSDDRLWPVALPLWHTAVIVWIAVLVQVRRRQNPRRDWPSVFPIALPAVLFSWMHPYLWSLALVYLHPLMAFWMLDLELRRSRPKWLHAYRLCLSCVPLILAVLWWSLSGAPPLRSEREEILTFQITQHAGAGILPGISTHLLVTTHTFLEMLHYGIWLIAMPAAGLRTWPWRLDRIPLGRRSALLRHLLTAVMVIAAGIVFFFWGFFIIDYSGARDLYFTVATAHVLAEVPFLLRAL